MYSRFPILAIQASRLFPAHLEVDDDDARAHGEEVGGDVLPAAEGGARLVAEGGAAAEGAAQEGQRPHRGVVVQRPARRPSVGRSSEMVAEFAERLSWTLILLGI